MPKLKLALITAAFAATASVAAAEAPAAATVKDERKQVFSTQSLPVGLSAGGLGVGAVVLGGLLVIGVVAASSSSSGSH